MNANHCYRPYQRIIRRIERGRLPLAATVATCAALATPAFADDEAPALSAIGIERGLELYDWDAADRCILGFHQIRITVNNVTEEGILKLELFGEKDFMRSSGKLRRIRVPAEDGPMRVCIHVPEAGEYAVVGYHDKDGDRKLDKKWNFKPKEPYGLSNNPEIKSLRLPKWEETRFTVPHDGVDIVINLVDLG
ncbi:hypothetical protein GCM10007854_03620 [Algimonas porphyrae]|uniref:DUF2141 domain-containing protein n=2 Tax=Algimonas porphyrae TaxID=1128113 RepID=A0ABQ5UX32_9PROT|nr:hypothetical protein GCM10007854_03620 [Algimonas porphyrae]